MPLPKLLRVSLGSSSIGFVIFVTILSILLGALGGSWRALSASGPLALSASGPASSITDEHLAE